MKHSLICITSLVGALFFISIASGKHHIKHPTGKNLVKPKSSAVQRQLLNNAKIVISTYEKDLKKSQLSLDRAKANLTETKKQFNIVMEKKEHGTKKEKAEARLALPAASTKFFEAENAVFRARNTQKEAAGKLKDAKKNLIAIQKSGWEKFRDKQRERAEKAAKKEPSIQLPRVKRNTVGVADSKRYSKEVKDEVFYQAYIK